MSAVKNNFHCCNNKIIFIIIVVVVGVVVYNLFYYVKSNIEIYVLQGPAGPPGKNGFPVFIHIKLL